MQGEGRPTQKMKEFLLGIRDRLLVLPALVARENIDPWRLARWLRTVTFRKELGRVLVELRVRVRLELHVLAGCAVREMSEMFRLKRPDEKMIALCVAIIEANRRSQADWRSARRQRRAARAVKPKRWTPDNLCHPNAREHEDELLAILAAPVEEEDAEGASEDGDDDVGGDGAGGDGGGGDGGDGGVHESPVES